MTTFTTINYLKTMFAGTTKNEISLEEAYDAAKLNMQNAKANRAWVGNKLTFFKKYNLADAVYARAGHSRVLTGIRLTETGKKALQERDFFTHTPLVPQSLFETPPAAPTNGNVISLKEVLEALSEVSKNNQGSKLSMDIKLKEGIVSIHMLRE